MYSIQVLWSSLFLSIISFANVFKIPVMLEKSHSGHSVSGLKKYNMDWIEHEYL